MKKVICVILFIITATIVFANIINIKGTYYTKYQYFYGGEKPQEENLKIKIEDSTWYIVCSQQYGADTFEYPCDGKMYTWYADLNDIQYPIKLNLDNLIIYVSITPNGSLLGFSPFIPASILMSKASTDDLACISKFTPLYGEVIADADNVTVLSSSSNISCQNYYYRIDKDWASISEIKNITTGEALVTISLDNNTTTEKRELFLLGSNGTILKITQPAH